MSGASKNISGAGFIGFGQLYVTGSVTTNTKFFYISQPFSWRKLICVCRHSNFYRHIVIKWNGDNLYDVIINGTSLQLSSGGVLGIAGVFTITSVFLNYTISGLNTVNFNGTGVSNSINPIFYSNLVLSNGNTKTAAGSITTNSDIIIETGTSFNPLSYNSHPLFMATGSITEPLSRVQALYSFSGTVHFKYNRGYHL